MKTLPFFQSALLSLGVMSDCMKLVVLSISRGGDEECKFSYYFLLISFGVKEFFVNFMVSFARTYTYSFFDLFAYFFVCHFGQTARILSSALSVFSRVLKAVKRT